MRHELEEHEGELVTLVGFPTGKKKQGNDLYHRPLLILPSFDVTNFCAPKETYELNVYLKRITTIDHLWLNPKVVEAGLYKYPFFQRCINDEGLLACIGRVERYQRNDGTTDYGLGRVSKLEKELCSFLTIETAIHNKFLELDSVYDFYKAAQHILKTTGKPFPYEHVGIFLDKYTDHVLKRYQTASALIDELEATSPTYSYRLKHYLMSMCNILTDVMRKLSTLHKYLTYAYKKDKKRLERKEVKKKARAKIRDRAIGFGPTSNQYTPNGSAPSYTK